MFILRYGLKLSFLIFSFMIQYNDILILASLSGIVYICFKNHSAEFLTMLLEITPV